MDLKEFEVFFEKELNKNQLTVSKESFEKYYTYMKNVLEWNTKINVTAVRDEENFIIKHYIDSLMISKYIDGNPRVIDIGTGAGFPGVPVKLYNENMKITLIDSINKKLNVIRESIKELDLKDIDIIHSRAEDLAVKEGYRESFDVATTRAVSNLSTILEYMLPFVKVGGISGLESFVRNLFYMVMISRMVNVVGEQGTYWVANNFIWGWLLLPVIQLGELIKQEIATNKESLRKNTLGYFFITTCICLLWVITIPLYKPFMSRILNFTEVDKLFNLVMVLLVFYMCYAFQNIFDSTFYGLGKTNYMLFESVVTNIIYYGVCFILYITNIFKPSLLGIALMFGIGNLFDSIVSMVAYLFLLKKESL